jgi:hypothetical protein
MLRIILQKPRAFWMAVICSILFAMIWIPVSAIDGTVESKQIIIPMAIAAFGCLLQRLLSYDLRVLFPVIENLRLIPMSPGRLLASILFWPALITLCLQTAMILLIGCGSHFARKMWQETTSQMALGFPWGTLGWMLLIAIPIVATVQLVWNHHYLFLFKQREFLGTDQQSKINVGVLGSLLVVFSPAVAFLSRGLEAANILAAIVGQILICVLLFWRNSKSIDKFYV